MNQKMNSQKNTETGKSNKIDIQIQYTKIFGVPILKTSFPKNSIDKLVGLTDSLLTNPKHIDYSHKLAGIIRKGKVTIEKLPFQQDIANMAGTSRETVSRVLKMFEEKNLIIKIGHKLIIPDYLFFKRLFGKNL